MRALVAVALLAAALAIAGTVLARVPAETVTAIWPWLAPICGPDAGETTWTFDAWITVPLALGAVLYALGSLRLARRTWHGRPRQVGHALAYLTGWAALAGALVSPLHRWGESLFTAHMIEHEIVMAVAAPLIVLARPGGALLWSLPPFARLAAAGLLARPWWKSFWSALTRPGFATLVHGAAIWGWHLPTLFDSAILNVALHRAQHLVFFLTAILFWWAILRRDSPGAGAGHLFVTMLHTSALGTLLALAPRVLYPEQTAGASGWGLSALEDQQLAGLVMWVPAGTVYAAAALILAARWIGRSGAEWKRTDAVVPL